MDLNLEGKVSIVTGASSGIGTAVAHGLAAEGAHVALAARRENILNELADELQSSYSGVEALAIPSDLTKPEEIERVVQLVHDKWGRVDILINNAGSSVFAPFDELTDEDWISGINLKLFGYVRMARAVLPHMLEQKSGRIINIAGNSGKQPLPYHFPGGAANSAILNFTRAVAEYAAPHVAVLAVCPGPVKTPRFDKQIRTIAEEWGQSVEEAYERFCADLPLKRIPTAEEVADTVVFLSSERAAYMTGTSITIDGGITRGI